MTALEDWGWDDAWAACLGQLAEGSTVGRVTSQHRDRWELQTQDGPTSGRLLPSCRPDSRPVVGDWVVAQAGPTPSDPLTMTHVLPRRSRFSRGVAGTGTTEQVLAANVDRVWIVHGLDLPPNPRRLERYLAVAWESGASPEIVLTKSDLAEDLDEVLGVVREVAIGVPSWVVTSLSPDGVTELRASLLPGCTVALLGPSGVGKSTLLNALAEADLMAVGEVRERDRKGRHTTTDRQLFRIRGGALLLDTPGIRELRVWTLDEGLDRTFPDIEELARMCRFRDCRHEAEPGCAVTGALAEGVLDPERLASFHKLRAEMAYLERKSDPRARAEAVAEHKTALKTVKYHPKYRDRQ